MVSSHHRFCYRYSSSEGLTGTRQSTRVGSIETPQPTPVRVSRTGHVPESIKRGGNHADNSLPWYSEVPKSDLRQRAKAVLVELYPLKIGFLELVEEGIEPKLLAELYAEIGIEIPLSSFQTAKANATENRHRGKDINTFGQMEPQSVSTNSPQTMSSQQNQGNALKDSFLGNPFSEKAGATGDLIPRDPHSSIDQNHLFPKKIALSPTQLNGELRTQVSNSVAAQTSITLPKTNVFTSKIAKTPASAILGKSTTVKSGEKALERKDYIARMLAAKAGRPIPTSVTIHITDTATIQPQEIQAKPESPKQVKPDEEENLLVENLSYQATELDVKTFFSGFSM